MLKFPLPWRVIAGLALSLIAQSAWSAAPIEIQLDSNYVAAGSSAVGKIVVDPQLLVDPDPKARFNVRLSVVRQHDVSFNGATKGKVQQVFTQPLDRKKAEPITFEVDGDGMQFGQMQLRVEVLGLSQTQPLGEAWSEPLQVGVRHRISLHGDWEVTKVEPLAYESQWRPKDWKQPPIGPKLSTPGPLTKDEWFRGWVSLKRQITWPAEGDRAPRILRISGVSNSAKLTINGTAIGEVLPLDQIEVLTHWLEYHSPYKGEDKKQLRMQMSDIDVQPPMTMALPELAKSGSASVEMTVRGTHGMFSGKTPYGIFGDLHLEATSPVFIESVSFDTEKPGAKRRFKFQLTIRNETGKPWTGELAEVYGEYEGETPYTGPCPGYVLEHQAIKLTPGKNMVEVVRDEMPRFATCRGTFMLVDDKQRVLDAEQQDFHTVVMEIRDRRDFYLNNERFLVKAQGSWGEDANSRLQLRLMGGNAFRSHRSVPARLYPQLHSAADNIDDRYKDGLLTSAGGALLASVEKCAFFDPKDTSNITRAVAGYTRTLGQCPGVIIWEATNELHGEPEEARVAIQEAFHKLDPYHRPVLATKGSGEWEAEAREGKVAGVDIVGVQYLLSREAVDSVTSAVTEQPIMSTEVNWNDITLHTQNMWKVWLDKGIAGSLLFDYSGNTLQQPAPLLPPAETENYAVIRQTHRQLYQDLSSKAEKLVDGSVTLSLGNRMPYTLHKVVVTLRNLGRFEIAKLAPGDEATLRMPDASAPPLKENVVAKVEYMTHSGLKHLVLATPTVVAAKTEGDTSK